MERKNKKIASNASAPIKKKLGRGIQALIDTSDGFQPEELLAKESSKSIVTLSIETIKANPHQPRRVFDEEKLKELAVSISHYGVLEPILVSHNISSHEYILVAGERRFRASKIAGLQEIPAIVLNVDDKEKLEIALIENIQREDLNSIEMAHSFKDIMALNKLTQEELANKIGVSRPVVSNYIRLLGLPEEIQESIKKGELTQSHARLLLSIDKPDAQKKLYNEILTKNLSVHSLEKIIDKAKKIVPSKQKNMLVYENALIQFFGTKVEIKGGVDKGKIVLEYFSKEDFQRIIDLLNLSID